MAHPVWVLLATIGRIAVDIKSFSLGTLILMPGARGAAQNRTCIAQTFIDNLKTDKYKSTVTAGFEQITSRGQL